MIAQRCTPHTGPDLDAAQREALSHAPWWSDRITDYVPVPICGEANCVEPTHLVAGPVGMLAKALG